MCQQIHLLVSLKMEHALQHLILNRALGVRCQQTKRAFNRVCGATGFAVQQSCQQSCLELFMVAEQCSWKRLHELQHSIQQERSKWATAQSANQDLQRHTPHNSTRTGKGLYLITIVAWRTLNRSNGNRWHQHSKGNRR